MNQDILTIKEVLSNTRSHLQKKRNVIATGVGYKRTGDKKTPELSIVCSVKRKESLRRLSSTDMVPKLLDGIPTDVFECGVIRALQGSGPTDRHRPAPGGVSIGHQDISAGTLGCIVEKDSELHILSNNHVLANSNDAEIGDAILQPGPYDGGKLSDDHIAQLAQFVPITFLDAPSNCTNAKLIADILNFLASLFGSNARLQVISKRATENTVDAAIAKPLKDSDIFKTNNMLGLEPVSGTRSGDLGMKIKKSGRTTGVTTGEILQTDVTVDVQYGVNQIARFANQHLAGPMSQGGDSGSAILTENNELVGLLFAGSNTTTIFNPFEEVFSQLGISLDF